MVTGHKDWCLLGRDTNLKPNDLHRVQKIGQPSPKFRLPAFSTLHVRTGMIAEALRKC